MTIKRRASLDQQIGRMVRSRLELEWLEAGGVELDDKGKLLIPKPQSRPGLYMFRFYWAGNLMKFYVGEGKDLATRTGQYRTHLSCLRVRKAMHAWLSGEEGKDVRMWVAYEATMLYEGEAPGDWEPAPLNSQANRLIAEAVAIGQMHAYTGPHVETLNKLRID